MTRFCCAAAKFRYHFCQHRIFRNEHASQFADFRNLGVEIRAQLDMETLVEE